jgi:hypothetical protein
MPREGKWRKAQPKRVRCKRSVGFNLDLMGKKRWQLGAGDDREDDPGVLGSALI